MLMPLLRRRAVSSAPNFCYVALLMILVCRTYQPPSYSCSPPGSSHRLHRRQRSPDYRACTLRDNNLDGLFSFYSPTRLSCALTARLYLGSLYCFYAHSPSKKLRTPKTAMCDIDTTLLANHLRSLGSKMVRWVWLL